MIKVSLIKSKVSFDQEVRTALHFAWMKYSTARKFFKTNRAIAAALQISSAAVGLWKAKDRVPLGRAYQLQKLTRGKLKVDESLYS